MVAARPSGHPQQAGGSQDSPLRTRSTALLSTVTASSPESGYIEPSAAWKGDGPRPLVAVASGTLGQGDQCAPSLALQYPLTLSGETVSVGYEDLAIYRLLSTGAAVGTRQLWPCYVGT